MNILTLLEMAASAEPDRVAAGSAEVGLTYAELLERSRALGTRLRSLESSYLAVLDLNSAALPVLLFGAAAAGIPYAPLNYRLTDEQIQAALDRLCPVMLAVGKEQRERVATAPGVIIRETTDLVTAPGEVEAGADGGPDPDAPAVLLFTSGTTGPPKAAVLRHRHLASYVISTVEFFGATPDEAILVSVPNYHIAGISSILTSVYSGRRIVPLPQFTPDGWVDVAVSERITHAMVVPTMLDRILDVLEQRGEKLPALRHLSYGGGRMPVQVVERALNLLPHVDFVNAYGLTETSSTIAVLGPEDHRAAVASEDPAVRARLGSVGRPLPTVELEIRDEDGRQVPVGTVGEVYVRGDQVAGEYLSYSGVDPDGWYRTRDRGRLDEAGYLFLEGRADDVIVRGGENLSPGEIEDVLREHPAVADAAVVGIPDREWGERVEAAVVLVDGHTATERDLQDWVRARLRSTRVPARIHWRESLPYTDTGKLLRRRLREELVAQDREETAP